MTNQNQIQNRKMAEPVSQPQKTSMNEIWSNPDAFQTAMRMANALSASTIVPREYQGEKGLGNCMIALEMANRLKTSPMMVMQNLYVVNGRPAWSSQYIIAMINNSKKYKTELQFEFEGKGDTMACTAFAEDYAGRVVKGPKITMTMAKAEGWVGKNGSKWKTMPEVMIRYRAASFFGRLNCPDLIMGLYSTDEVMEGDFTVVEDVSARVEKEIDENANSEVLDPKHDKEAEKEVETETEEPLPDSEQPSLLDDEVEEDPY